MKFFFNPLLALILIVTSPFLGKAQNKEVLWQYTMTDGSTIHAMSDNGKWAVAYGISDATSSYSFPKLIDFTNHTQQEILSETEFNSGVECYVNDVSNDASVVVGCYCGQPAYWNAASKTWTTLPLANNKLGGRIEAVSPDGKYAVGVCTNGGFDEVPVMWDITQKSIINLENLPSCDLSGGYQEMMRLTDISADGRYIVGCVSYSYPEDVLYFLYDRTLKQWDALAFDFNETSQEFTSRYNQVRTLDGITISPNGKWVAGVVYSTSDARNPFRYNTETKVFENFNRPEDLDKGCVSVDNEGTIYAATPAINPSRSLYILHKNNWYGIDEILKQQCGIDFYKYTGYAATGLCIDISDDCKTMAAIAYITDENYQITLPTTFAEACENVNLLATYTSSIRSGANIQKLSNITLTFTRDVEVNLAKDAITLLDENGNVVRNSTKFTIDNSSSKNVSIGFRTITLDADKTYSVVIPEGAISIKGDKTKTNQEIVLKYVGLGDEPIQMVQVSPTSGSTLGHIDVNTNPVIFTYNIDVKVKDGSQALVYRNDETEPLCSLEMQHGKTVDSYNMVLVYPTTTFYLYKDNTYRIVVPAETITDAAGYSTNTESEVTYEGSYERTIVSDDSHIYIETFEGGVNNVMTYDGDLNEPTDAMKAWGFTSNTAWGYAADDDYTNPCAVSHSSYTTTDTPSNDWMVTPQLVIPDNKCELTFRAQSYKKAKSDVLKVYVYASEDVYNELDESIVQTIQNKADLVFDKLLSPGATEDLLDGEWEEVEISLEKYAGKKVYIAFVNQNHNQSAIFVGNVLVSHSVDFQISLNVDEMVVNKQSQIIKGAVHIKAENNTYSSASVSLLNENGDTLETIFEDNLTLSVGQQFDFAFATPLPLQVGKECPFSIVVNLDNGVSSYQFKSSIKNLAFAPTKRVILEEMTGMGCNNCPMGHQAIEHLNYTYGDLFIPIAYHTYIGDPLESGMTDYTQYFLGLTGAPSAIIQRSSLPSSPMVSTTEGGATDYSFHSSSNDTWMDIVAQELNTPSIADLKVKTIYNVDTNDLILNYTYTPALTHTNANIGLLCVVTEDSLQGYQSNKFYLDTDSDLGPWAQGGMYGKSNVVPFTFFDVARALFPANAYYGQTGLLPTELNASTPYKGVMTLNSKVDAPYVKNIINCNVTLIAIDANTGSVINAARASVRESMTSINTLTNVDKHSVVATERGIKVSTLQPTTVSIYNAQGKLITKLDVNHQTEISLQQKGLILVKMTDADHTSVYKVMR